MEEIKKSFRLLMYGWLLERHIRIGSAIDNDYETAHKYHYDMARYYFEKIYKKKYKEKF